MLTSWPPTAGSTAATSVTTPWNATFFDDAVRVMPAVPRADAVLDKATSIPSDASTAMSFWRADMALIVRDASSNGGRADGLEVGRDRVDDPVVVVEHRDAPATCRTPCTDG